MKKGITKNQVRNAFKWCKKLKIETVAFFILGFPTETYKEIKKTIKFSKELKPDYVEFSLVTPHFDTELYSLCKKYGQVNIDEWSNFKTHSVNSLPFISNSISERKLKFMYKWAYFSFYLNPFYIFKKLKECDLKRLIRGLSVIINR